MAQQEIKKLGDKLLSIRGFVFPENWKNLTPQYLDSLRTFQIRDDDVYVVTFPKSGTVWSQRILTLLYEDEFPEAVDQTTFDRMPWLEMNQKEQDYSTRRSPRLFCSHLPEHLIPCGLQDKGKIIYVRRNPKDITVSYFHFSHYMKSLKTSETYNEVMEKFFSGQSFSPSPLPASHFHHSHIPPTAHHSFDDQTFYLNGAVFKSGQTVVGGCWFDHVKGWYNNKDKYNILFLSYEEMIRDLRGAIVKICEFLGKNVSDDIIDSVVEKTSFNNMKNDPKANYTFLPEDIANSGKSGFLRKGTVGDWKNSLTVAQNEHFDRVYQERMTDLPLEFVWDVTDLHT